MPQPREHILHAADGTELFMRDWIIDAAHGAVVTMHGLGEHCGRYAHVAQFFNARARPDDLQVGAG